MKTVKNQLDDVTEQVNSQGDDVTKMIILSQVNSLNICGPQIVTLFNANGLSVQPSLKNLDWESRLQNNDIAHRNRPQECFSNNFSATFIDLSSFLDLVRRNFFKNAICFDA